MFILILLIIINILFIYHYLKKIFDLNYKTYYQLQDYLKISKPDELFKNYFNKYCPKKSKKNQIITIEFNENYKSYHAGKACMSDIVNNLKYSFPNILIKNSRPYLEKIKNTWYLINNNEKINLDIPFKNNVVNLHINYIDLKHIAQNVKYETLKELSEIMTNITKYSNKYIIYDIYNDKILFKDIKIKTWSEYIDKCLNVHYYLCEHKDNEDKIQFFKEISKKYSYIFENNILKLYNPKTNDIILPHPDGLIV